MPFDSFISAALLFAASAGGWALAGRQRAASRLYVRFAAILMSALAVCAGLDIFDAKLGAAGALFLLPLVCGALAVAILARFARRLPDLAASLLLAFMLAIGLAAALTGWIMLSLVPVVLAGLLIGAVALGAAAPLAVMGALSLLAAALAFLQQGAGAGFLLFLAAAIVGLSRASASAVNQPGTDLGGPAIGSLG